MLCIGPVLVMFVVSRLICGIGGGDILCLMCCVRGAGGPAPLLICFAKFSRAYAASYLATFPLGPEEATSYFLWLFQGLLQNPLPVVTFCLKKMYNI